MDSIEEVNTCFLEVIGTPGRLNDFIQRECIGLAYIQVLILDEADRMLDMGFEPQIRTIIEEADMPPKTERQTLMFSATFPDEMQRMAQNYLREYVYITVGKVGSTTDSITQRLWLAEIGNRSNGKREKMALLYDALKEKGKTLVFVGGNHLDFLT